MKVTKEIYERNFYPGSCSVCKFYNEKTDRCEIEDEAREATIQEAKMFNMDPADASKMDCVLWNYKYEIDCL